MHVIPIKKTATSQNRKIKVPHIKFFQINATVDQIKKKLDFVVNKIQPITGITCYCAYLRVSI